MEGVFQEGTKSSCFPCKSLKNKFTKNSRKSTFKSHLEVNSPGPSRNISSPSSVTSCKYSCSHRLGDGPCPELSKWEHQYTSQSFPTSPASLSPTLRSPSSLSPISSNSGTLTDNTIKPSVNPLPQKEVVVGYVELSKHAGLVGKGKEAL